MPKALLFPGQGSQKIGMGKDLYDHSPMVRALFEEADDAVGKSLSDICFKRSQRGTHSNRKHTTCIMSCHLWCNATNKPCKYVPRAYFKN